MSIWTIGAYNRMKYFWHLYFDQTQGLIFIVDSSDESMILESKIELERLFGFPELEKTILLVFANKKDQENSKNTVEMANVLGLNALNNRIWKIKCISGIIGEGVFEGINWICEQVENSIQINKDPAEYSFFYPKG